MPWSQHPRNSPLDPTQAMVVCVHLPQVINVAVRANAATLLMEAFPLCDPAQGVEERDATFQKQFDLLQVHLQDKLVVVLMWADHPFVWVFIFF